MTESTMRKPGSILVLSSGSLGHALGYLEQLRGPEAIVEYPTVAGGVWQRTRLSGHLETVQSIATFMGQVPGHHLVGWTHGDGSGLALVGPAGTAWLFGGQEWWYGSTFRKVDRTIAGYASEWEGWISGVALPVRRMPDAEAVFTRLNRYIQRNMPGAFDDLLGTYGLRATRTDGDWLRGYTGSVHRETEVPPRYIGRRYFDELYAAWGVTMVERDGQRRIALWDQSGSHPKESQSWPADAQGRAAARDALWELALAPILAAERFDGEIRWATSEHDPFIVHRSGLGALTVMVASERPHTQMLYPDPVEILRYSDDQFAQVGLHTRAEVPGPRRNGISLESWPTALAVATLRLGSLRPHQWHELHAGGDTINHVVSEVRSRANATNAT